MSDSLIKDEILVKLDEKGSVTVPTHGEFRHALGVHGSSNEVKRALGSLIKTGQVQRRRRPPQGCSELERPITFSLLRVHY